MKFFVERIKKDVYLHHQIILKSSYMETNLNNTEFYRTDRMSNLSVGDIFLFSSDGFKYVFLGFTPDGGFCYKRCEMRSKRKIYSRRNRCVFIMDIDGCIYISEGQILVDYNRMKSLCAMRL